MMGDNEAGKGSKSPLSSPRDCKSEGDQAGILAVYEESLRKTIQDRKRLEDQLEETERQLLQLENAREKIQEDVRHFMILFGNQQGDKKRTFIVPNRSKEEDNKALLEEKKPLEQFRRNSKEDVFKPTTNVGSQQPSAAGNTLEPLPKDSSTTEMLGGIVAVNKRYKKSVQEFEVLKTQKPSTDLVSVLLEKVQLLRKQNDELRWKLQTSDDEANFMDTLSEAVKICDSRGDVATKQKLPLRVIAKAERQPIKLVNGGNAMEEYANASSSSETETTKGKTKSKLRKSKKGKGKKKKGKTKEKKGKKKKKKKGEKTPKTKRKAKPDASDEENSSSSTSHSQEVPTLQYEEKPPTEQREEVLLKSYHEIAFEELQLDSNPLGNGAFGVVYKALWRGTEVAVKKLLVLQFNEAEIYNFKREAAFLERYSNHPNIVKFCGICTAFPNYAIITEFMEKGCIRDVLLKDTTIPWKRVISMAVDAAAGVLHLHKEKIIHRDLALRNLLVGADWRVRLADFGLARMMPKETYAKTRGNIGAVRWLAPEVISDHVYSEKSDAYAFGIVMWELLTKKEPFEEIERALDVALAVLRRGIRPTIPSNCPPEYERLMKECWAQNQEERPSFVEIHKRLKEYRDSLPDSG